MEMTNAFWEETWRDQQQDNDDNNDNDNIEDNEAMMTMTLREHPERVSDPRDLWSLGHWSHLWKLRTTIIKFIATLIKSDGGSIRNSCNVFSEGRRVSILDFIHRLPSYSTAITVRRQIWCLPQAPSKFGGRLWTFRSPQVCSKHWQEKNISTERLRRRWPTSWTTSTSTPPPTSTSETLWKRRHSWQAVQRTSAPPPSPFHVSASGAIWWLNV